MRSPLIEQASYITDKDLYSDLQVCQSAAGYYIGTNYATPEGFTEPGSRDSQEYWPHRSQAEQALATGEWTQRTSP